MIYQEAEQLLIEGKGDEILDHASELFVRVEQISKDLRAGAFAGGEEISALLLESTGIWEYLNVLYSAIDTYKTEVELNFYHNLKIETDKDEKKKFVDGTAKQEASNHVMTERRIRNIVKAYLDACEKNIGSSQSYLKYLSEGYKRQTQ